ncbi:MAG: bifunctional adenosylcobinamide kinase/adenosylcobinamide-phosphate guanylyltransferase, partial [Pseudomonadota bacterium]|nr:bifunctional adenosylcobinamide kinase/adenosylcobinamide-phosphate guanylyltransferase [Pseudomonadota bacterium]
MGLHLVLGGARSGKSAFAEAAAKAVSLERAASSRAEPQAEDSGSIRPGQRLYLATSRIYDSAHEDRIAKHR